MSTQTMTAAHAGPNSGRESPTWTNLALDPPHTPAYPTPPTCAFVLQETAHPKPLLPLPPQLEMGDPEGPSKATDGLLAAAVVLADATVGAPEEHLVCGKATPASRGASQQLMPSSEINAVLSAGSSEAFLAPGYSFSVYDSELQHHYTIPSHRVTATSGALKYATYHERYGLGTRFRFQLCSKFALGRCTDGRKCNYIHALVDASAGGKNVHINENLADCNTIQDVVNSQQRRLVNTHAYRLIPDGVLIAIHAPNAHDEPPQLIYSGNLLMTNGSLAAYNSAMHQVNRTNGQGAHHGMRPRHCAHFQFRKMCNLGEECNFIHSLAPYVQPKFRRSQDPPLLPPEPTSPPDAKPSTARTSPPAPQGGPPEKEMELKRTERESIRVGGGPRTRGPQWMPPPPPVPCMYHPAMGMGMTLMPFPSVLVQPPLQPFDLAQGSGALLPSSGSVLMFSPSFQHPTTFMRGGQGGGSQLNGGHRPPVRV